VKRSLVYGGGLAVDHHPFRHLGWWGALSVQGTSRELGPGRGSALLGSAAAALTISWPSSWGRVVTGAGGRLGVAHLAAEADDPAVAAGTVTGIWAGPMVLAGVRIATGPVLLSLGIELTYVTLPVKGRVTGEAPYGVDGLFVLGSAGVGLSL
jgi:hypothetical protein